MTTGTLRVAGVLLSAMLLLVAVVTTARAQQQSEQMKLRLARALEQSGDYEHALRLYEQLDREHPGLHTYDDPRERLLVNLKRYDEAIALHRERILTNTADPTLSASLGTLLYRAGHEQEASALWDSLLSAQPQNINLVLIVASEQTECRLLDRAIATYVRGRDGSGDPTLFSTQLAALMVATMDYRGASAELLRWFTKNPGQIAFIESRMSAFTGREEGRKAALDAVESALIQKETPQLYQLLGWLHLEGKDYEAALNAYAAYDRTGSTNGTGLLELAEKVLADGSYGIAAEAYRRALAGSLPPARKPAAMFGYASALDGLAAHPDSAYRPSQTGTAGQDADESPVRAFTAVAEHYPQTELGARAWIRIGIIRRDREEDLQVARKAFERALASSVGPPSIRSEANLQLGKLLVMQGDTVEAGEHFRAVADRPDATPDQIDEATFRLAELAYFSGRFTEALAMLDSMSVNVRADFANDALALKAFIAENADTPAGLRAYARADLLARQRHVSEAIAQYRTVIRQYQGSALIDDALMTMAGLQNAIGQYDDAVATYRTLLDSVHTGSIALDRAQFRLAEVYQLGVKNIPAALAAYEKLLASYPQSLLAGEARRRIRMLRGETP